MSRLDEIKARCEEASQGPWWATLRHHFTDEGCAFRKRNGRDSFLTSTLPMADAAFIAHSRADVPYLVARVERLEEALRGLAERDCEYGDGCPTFGTRHGPCVGCVARAALEASE